MSRRFNFTGRDKILREHLQIFVVASESQLTCRVFLNLTSYKIPADAQVMIEAARGRVLRVRHSWGLAGKALTADGAFSEFDISSLGDQEGLSFRVLVVEPETRRLLASAESVSANDDMGDQTPQRSLLPIVMRDLQGGVWELEDMEENPTLVLDINLGTKQEIKSSPVLSALLPGVIRAILVSLVYEHQDTGGDDDGDSECSSDRWLSLGVKWAGCPLPDNLDHRDIDNWAQKAVTGFCREKKLRHQLASCITQEG
ncbi:hypothetical protein K5D53_01390 [Pseudomonas cichorii]|uniref:hypothetical protein n=1 Tax=Pseudomonas cichorii TaxID=36746 RepID=UPI001C888E60|nr:hypothetical protein [Pseudomonas cichorii]MBX8529136.1 hypothetical protein [Pseudomonas cichorii]MBX8543281.1 hypothetical protein [Pseudomonas cichorii]